MRQKIYQVDAFTNKVFSGNPAAVCPRNEWLSDAMMQQIAMENNLAETAFYVKQNDQYELRWFTPTEEVDLCGHATLAAAYVLFYHEGFQGDTIPFYSPRSGPLTVSRRGDLLTLNFPTDTYKQIELSEKIFACFDVKPQQAYKGKTDYMLVFENEDVIKNIKPAFHIISNMEARGIIITAPGNKVDFVSRFFAPQTGVHEDHVTGSAHTTLTPYWSKRLGKKSLNAIQLSERKGHLHCVYLNDRVEISGQAKLYMVGELFLE
jgi:PhzF family phenazine biosynthesis protein